MASVLAFFNGQRPKLNLVKGQLIILIDFDFLQIVFLL